MQLDSGTESAGVYIPQPRIENALLRVLKALVFRDDPGATYGEMPLSQLRCLHFIAEHQGQKMNELSQRMEVKLPAVSQIVDRLVRRGLVERYTDTQDRRVVRLELTPEARTMTEQMRKIRAQRMESTLKLLSSDEIVVVITGLEVMAAAAEKLMAVERGTETEKEVISPVNEMIVRSGRGKSGRRAKADSGVSP